MKKLASLVSILALIVFISGCATAPTEKAPAVAIRAFPVPNKLSNQAVLQAAVDVAKSLNLPAATTVDNGSGLASFPGPVGGMTAQVSVISNTQIQITISSSAASGQNGADQTAEQFAAKLDAKLKSL